MPRDVASVVVPLSKLFALTYLLLSVRRGSTSLPLQKAKLYRAVELVGKWSMLDIYVVALLATVVKFQSLASITAAPGAVAFGAVVILTMLAAQSFDPRLVWDSAERGGRPAAAPAVRRALDETSGRSGRSMVREPAGGAGYEALVGAYNRARAKVSRDIGAVVRAY